MGTLTDAFTTLTEEVQVQLSEASGIVLVRDIVGTFAASSGTESGGTTIISGTLRCVRGSDRVENIPGASGGFSRKRIVEFLVSVAELAADAGWLDGPGGSPKENDRITDGTVQRRVTRVEEQVNRTMWRITTMSEA